MRCAKGITPFLAVLLLGAILFEPASAEHRGGRGSIRHSSEFQRREYRIYYYDHERIRLQREAISAQDEARREQGREVRRREIAEDLERSEREFLESQEALRRASRASLGAPRGAYYRRPGSVVTALPAGHEAFEVEGAGYRYFEGIFFRDDPRGHVAVTAPAGAAVAAIPGSALEIMHDGATYYYYFGTFFTRTGERFTVSKPPEGAVVPYLPDGYRTDRADGTVIYSFGGVNYRPLYRDGVLVYAASGPAG